MESKEYTTQNNCTYIIVATDTDDQIVVCAKNKQNGNVAGRTYKLSVTTNQQHDYGKYYNSTLIENLFKLVEDDLEKLNISC